MKRSRRGLLHGTLALLALGVAQPARAEAVWALGNHLALLDAATRALVAPVATVAGTAEGTLSGVASNPANGTIYVVAYAEDPDRTLLFRVDATTGVATEGPTILGHRLSDIAFAANGKLYGVSTACDLDDPAALFEINPQNGAATKRAQLDDGGGCASPAYGALAANPQNGDLYFATFNADDETIVQHIDLPSFALDTPLAGDDAGVFPTAMVFRQDGTALLAEQSFFFSWAPGGALQNLGAAVSATAAGNVSHPAVGLSPAQLDCSPSPTAVCLNRGRFRVSVTYNAQQSGNGQGPGKVLLESRDATKFWFFDPSNVELLVKVLDGCGLNNKFWVFSAGLTNVGVTLTVVDSKNGAQKVYTNPQNTTYAPKLDTAAFSCS